MALLKSTTMSTASRNGSNTIMPARLLFADTFYWVALLNPRDSFHNAVMSYSRTLGAARVVTTDEIFTETLTFWSGSGPYWRGLAAAQVRNLRKNPAIDVLPQTRADFDAALALFEARPDKGYSLTDCRSMLGLRALNVTEVLTNDHHFTQEGFTILFP
jgi:predicted nucleic acid-binding protein